MTLRFIPDDEDKKLAEQHKLRGPRVPDSMGIGEPPSGLTAQDKRLFGTHGNQRTAPKAPVAGARGLPLSPVPGRDPEAANQKLRFVPDNEQYRKQRYSFARQPIPPDMNPIVGPIMDAGIGAWDLIAQGTGLGANVIDSILVEVGADGFLETPGEGYEAVSKAMKKLGIPADKRLAVKELVADIGADLFQNLLLTSVMFAAAPMMAAKTGQTVWAGAQRQMGQALQANPGTAVMADVGMSVGGETGQRAGAAMGQPMIGEITGTMMGGIAGGAPRAILDAAVGGAKGAAKGALPGAVAGGVMGGPEMGVAGAAMGSVIPGMSGAVKGAAQSASQRLAVKTIPNRALLREAEAQRAHEFAREAVAGDQARIETMISRTIQSVQTRAGSPAQAAERMNEEIRQTYRQMARPREEAYWARVDQRRPVPTAPLKGMVNGFLRRYAREAQSQNLPMDLIGTIRRLPPNVTMQRLRDVGTMLFERSQMGTTPGPGGVMQSMSDTMRAHTRLMSQEIYATIERTYPGDAPLAQAREFSRWLHDRFTRGPTGKFADVRKMDTARADPQPAMERMVRDSRSGAAVRDIADTLHNPALTRMAEDWVRASFREEAAGMDLRAAGAGQKWLAKPEIQSFMREFPPVAAELDAVTNHITRLAMAQKALDESAFKRFQGEDTATAIGALFGSSNKVAGAREITKKLSGDKEALDSFRNGIVAELWKSAEMDPVRLWDRIHAKDIQPMLAEVLDAPSLARLNRIVESAKHLKTEGSVGSTRRAVAGASDFLARIFGVSVGTQVGQATGGHSLTTAGIVSRAMRNVTSRLFAQIPVEELLAKAVTDPHYERLLFMRDGRNLAEAQRSVKQMKLMLSGGGAALDVIENQGDMQ